MDMEAQVLEIIRELRGIDDGGGISIKEIARRFIEQHGEDFERKVTRTGLGASCGGSWDSRASATPGTTISRSPRSQSLKGFPRTLWSHRAARRTDGAGNSGASR